MLWLGTCRSNCGVVKPDSPWPPYLSRMKLRMRSSSSGTHEVKGATYGRAGTPLGRSCTLRPSKPAVHVTQQYMVNHTLKQDRMQHRVQKHSQQEPSGPLSNMQLGYYAAASSYGCHSGCRVLVPRGPRGPSPAPSSCQGRL